jgi:fatty acid desaturase
MDHDVTPREALSAVDPAALVALRRASDRAGLVHLAGHAALIAVTGTAVALADRWLLLAPAVLAHGVALTFLFAPLHETIHGTAFRTAWINRAVAAICGAVLVLPPNYFRWFHFAHHRFTQDPDRDPELVTPKPRTRADYLYQLSGIGYWAGQVRILFRFARGGELPDFVPARARGRAIGEARAYLAVYLAIFALATAGGWLSWVLWLWVVPVVAGQPALRAFLLAEHTGCPLVPEMLENSRTTFTNGAVMWLAWNMPNHTAHHLLPTVPFHALPRATSVLSERIAITAPGYLAVHKEIAARLSA